jgi:hypothetical protein
MNNSLLTLKPGIKSLLIIPGLAVAILIGWATAAAGWIIPVLLFVLALVIPFIIVVFQNPRIGFISFIIYCFCITLFSRYIIDIPFLYGIEALLLLSWLGAFFHKSQYNWAYLKNELCFFGLLWFFITVMELANPEAGSFLGWISDARYPLLWLLCVPLCMVVFNKKKDLDLFLVIILALSLLAALYGIKQLRFGLSSADLQFIQEGGYRTHLLFGQLRVFSFYQDAAQFGMSMAQLSVVALVLALGPFKWWKRLLFVTAGLIFGYAMFISGTRGAIFTLFAGMFVALIISKNVKVFIVGCTIVLGGFVFLKYTNHLNGNAEIRRMRSALNPKNASFNVRLANQARLKEYLHTRPFGAGLGALGYAGKTYNKGTYVATIPPDSYWVKVWAMYGIVGLIIWFGIMMYIFGKCAGIVWDTKDPGLRFKLGALTAGAAGIFFSSYGNEVMNNMPSAMILYVSWAFVFLGPKLAREVS